MMRYICSVLLLGLFGCVEPFNDATLYGVYQFDEEDTRQIIHVEPAGAYTNSLWKSGREVWSEKDTWVVEKDKNKSRIVFSNFKSEFPPFTQTKGFWSVEPERSLMGRKKLCFDNDLRRCFETS